MKELKVWGGRYMSAIYGNSNSHQTRGLVCAYTKKQACELAGISYAELTNYWCITGNKRELETVDNTVGFYVYDMSNNTTGMHNDSDPIIPLCRILTLSNKALKSIADNHG